MIEEIAYFFLVMWAIGTTVYGLYLSRQNNKKYNQRIVELLEKLVSQNDEKTKRLEEVELK